MPEVRKRTLGEFLDFKNGKTSPDRIDGGEIPVYGSNGRIGWATTANASEDTIIIGRVGSYCGSTHFSPQPCWVTDNAIACIAPNGEAKFWFHALTMLNLNNYRAGSGQPLLNQSILRQIELRTPSQPDRIAIGEILGALDDKIELNWRMNETLEAMARAIFKDWFVDFGPTRAKMEGRAPYLASDIWALFPDRMDDDGKPEGWGGGKLRDVLELAYGKSLPARDRVEGGVPVYGSGGFSGWHDSALVNGPTVIVGRKGTVGSIYWEPRPSFPIDTVFFVRSQLPLIYCLYLLESLGLESMNTDAAVPGLNRENAYRLDVIYEPSVISAFDVVTSPLRARMDTNTRENETLAATRDLLLPKLMSGEIRIRDAEKVLEAAA